MFWFGGFFVVVVWGFFWSVSCLVGFGFFVSVEFWGFCLLYFVGVVCWCAFRRSVLLDLG